MTTEEAIAQSRMQYAEVAKRRKELTEEREVLITMRTGLGDDVHKLAQKIGADRFMKIVERITNHPCKCPQRRESLNRFPSVIEEIKKALKK